MQLSPRTRHRLYLFFLVAPTFVVLFGVVIYPFFYNIVLSLFEYESAAHPGLADHRVRPVCQGVHGAVAAGFLRRVLEDDHLDRRESGVSCGAGGVPGAAPESEGDPRERLFRAILVLPWAVPQFIVALTWRGMFNYEYGAINLMLTQWLGLEGVQWLRQPLEAFIAVIVTNVWLGFPFMMVIALGALQSIPHDLYEAADIDGASWHHKLRHITIPLIRPVMVPAITLGTIWTFNNLNIVWLVSNAGEPSDQTHLLVSFVYKAAFNFYRYGYGAALSMVIFVILLVFSLSFMRKSKATDNVYS